MPAQKRKTAWYMMAFVTAIVIVVSLFLPLNASEDKSSDSLFTKIAEFFQTEREEKKDESRLEIVIGGDVMLGRSVNAVSIDREDNSYPFRKIASVLKNADISFVNLENAIVEDCPKVYRNTLKFCGRPEMIEGLTLAGIDIVTLANNHSRNYGDEGYRETIGHLTNAGVEHTDENLVVFEIDNTKYGFLGFDFVLTEPDEEDYKFVKESSQKVDFLLLGIHWGVEYTPDPREAQRKWANRFVESGADFIAGHHPHWVQSNERINGVPVYYSLGNLIFDQMETKETRTGLLVKLIFEKGKLTEVQEIETYMEDWAQPIVKIDSTE